MNFKYLEIIYHYIYYLLDLIYILIFHDLVYFGYMFA